MNDPSRRRTSLRHKLLLLLGSTLFFSVALEVTLQIVSFAVRTVRDRGRVEELTPLGDDVYRILCLGESTTEGYGNTSYPELLYRALTTGYPDHRFQVVNGGFVAEPTTVLVGKLEALIEQQSFDMVIVMMGINDPYYFSDPETLGLSPETQSILLKSRVFRLTRIAWSNLKARLATDGPRSHGYPEVAPDKREHHRAYVRRYWDAMEEWNGGNTDSVEENFRALIRMAREVATEDLDAAGSIINIPESHLIYYYNSYANLAEYYEKLDRLDVAVALYEEAVEKHPGVEFFLRGLGGIYETQGEAALAGSYFEQADRLARRRVLGVTKDSYGKVMRLLRERGIVFVAMQYPKRSVSELEYLLGGSEDPIYVDNEASFFKAVAESGYDELFSDRFAGDFGHCTASGNQLIVDNLMAQAFEPLFGAPQSPAAP